MNQQPTTTHKSTTDQSTTDKTTTDKTTTGKTTTDKSSKNVGRPSDRNFSCLISYSSQSSYNNGARDIKEHLRVKYPEMDIVADRVPDKEDTFDVKIKKGDGSDVIMQTIPSQQLKTQIEPIMNDITKRIDEEFRKFDEEFGKMGFPSLGFGEKVPSKAIGK